MFFSIFSKSFASVCCELSRPGGDVDRWCVPGMSDRRQDLFSHVCLLHCLSPHGHTFTSAQASRAPIK